MGYMEHLKLFPKLSSSLWTTEKERSSLRKDYRSRSVLPFTESSIKLIVQYEKPKILSVRQKWNDLLLLMLMEKT